jgi:hypothetical protein
MRRKRKKAGRKGGSLSAYEKWMQNEENKARGIATPHFVPKDQKAVNINGSKFKDLHALHGTSVFQKKLLEKKNTSGDQDSDVETPAPKLASQRISEFDVSDMYEPLDEKIAGTWADEQVQDGISPFTQSPHADMDDSGCNQQPPCYEGELGEESTHNPVAEAIDTAAFTTKGTFSTPMGFHSLGGAKPEFNPLGNRKPKAVNALSPGKVPAPVPPAGRPFLSIALEDNDSRNSPEDVQSATDAAVITPAAPSPPPRPPPRSSSAVVDEPSSEAVETTGNTPDAAVLVSSEPVPSASAALSGVGAAPRKKSVLFSMLRNKKAPEGK